MFGLQVFVVSCLWTVVKKHRCRVIFQISSKGNWTQFPELDPMSWIRGPRWPQRPHVRPWFLGPTGSALGTSWLVHSWRLDDARGYFHDLEPRKPPVLDSIWARVKRRYERLQLRSAITTQNMWFTVCSDRGPYVAIPLFRLCLWLKLPVGRMTFQSFDVRVRHWSSRSGLVFLGSCKMACRQVYMR